MTDTMKSDSASTIRLAIVFFAVSLAVNLSQSILFEMDLLSIYLSYANYLTPLVMTAVVLADMIHHHRIDWTLLVITFCTGGCGAALYPLWHKITGSGKEMKNLLAVIAILVAAQSLFGILTNTYSFRQFALRNVWAPHLGWFISLVAVAYAVKLLKMMNCKRALVWIFALTLTLFKMNAGIIILLLYVAVYGTQHPGKGIINKYLVLITVVTIYNRFGHWAIEQLGLFDTHFDLATYLTLSGSAACTVAMIILLIIDAVRLPIKGRVWRLLPALFNPLYSVIAIQDTQEQNQDRVEQQ